MTSKEAIFSVLRGEKNIGEGCPWSWSYSFLLPRGEKPKEKLEKRVVVFFSLSESTFSRKQKKRWKSVLKKVFESGLKFTFRRLSTPVGR